MAGEASMGTMTTTAMLIKMVEAEAAAEVDAGAVGAVGAMQRPPRPLLPQLTRMFQADQLPATHGGILVERQRRLTDQI